MGTFAAFSRRSSSNFFSRFFCEYADLEHCIEQYLDVIVLARKVSPHHSHFRSI
ncbi:hypothetical protein PORCAN_1160 [Porphyromonas crevioricanis JCM 13913]|nr:hypothetical protein PORCAN_1160 [Porphyromonas crevioricanis JCM 13913]